MARKGLGEHRELETVPAPPQKRAAAGDDIPSPPQQLLLCTAVIYPLASRHSEEHRDKMHRRMQS